MVTDEMREWARVEAPGVDVDRQTAKFQDHTFKGAHSDWPATWRNWIREAFDRVPRASGTGAKSFRQQDIDAKTETVRQMTGGLLGGARNRNQNTIDMEAPNGTLLALD